MKRFKLPISTILATTIIMSLPMTASAYVPYSSGTDQSTLSSTLSSSSSTLNSGDKGFSSDTTTSNTIADAVAGLDDKYSSNPSYSLNDGVYTYDEYFGEIIYRPTASEPEPEPDPYIEIDLGVQWGQTNEVFKLQEEAYEYSAKISPQNYYDELTPNVDYMGGQAPVFERKYVEPLPTLEATAPTLQGNDYTVPIALGSTSLVLALYILVATQAVRKQIKLEEQEKLVNSYSRR